MKVIVGLGNPGPRYRATRHNVGFMTLDLLAKRLNTAFDREKNNGLLAQANYQGTRLLLVKPVTFMNLSGQAVAPAVRNQMDTFDDLLVIVDDVSLPVGRIRLRADGSAGGHNGLKSIIEHLGTQAFPRLRIGVGENRAAADLADHVLGTFVPEEKAALNESLERAVDAALLFVTEGMEKAMNRYN